MKVNTLYFLDDEPDLCDAFSIFFEADSRNVEVFNDHRKAIKKANISPPDVMFIDFRLDGINGEEVAKAIPASVIKVMLTGELDMQPSELFFDVIHKPYKLAELANCVQRIEEKLTS